MSGTYGIYGIYGAGVRVWSRRDPLARASGRCVRGLRELHTPRRLNRGDARTYALVKSCQPVPSSATPRTPGWSSFMRCMSFVYNAMWLASDLAVMSKSRVGHERANCPSFRLADRVSIGDHRRGSCERGSTSAGSSCRHFVPRLHDYLSRRHVRIALLLSGIAGFAILGPASAAELPTPILNPRFYSSPSGRYVLFVNPSDLYGRGKAAYGLTIEGREVWLAEKPYTLCDARVADDGVVTGYAYSHGWRGLSPAGYKAGFGDFRGVIIDSRGKERLNQAAKRQASGETDAPPNPIASRLIMDVVKDRLFVRVRNIDPDREDESWWVYQLSTGQKLDETGPREIAADPRPVRFLMDAKPVNGTPLSLFHWWRYDSERAGKRSARFTVIDHDGKPVWSLDLPADYESGGDGNADERLMASVRRTGGILGPGRGDGFELRFVKDAQAQSHLRSPARRAGRGRFPRLHGAPLSKRSILHPGRPRNPAGLASPGRAHRAEGTLSHAGARNPRCEQLRVQRARPDRFSSQVRE